MNGERMQRTGDRCRLASAAFLAAVFLAGCAEKGPILLSIDYQPPAATTTAAASAPVAGVSPFIDARGMEPSVLGERTILNGQKDPLVVQGTVADLVTAVVKKALVARGIAVKSAPAWDLSADGIKAEGAGLLLGGEIKTLRLESTAVSLKTRLKASVQLKIVAGDATEKKIIRMIDVNSVVEQDILYSREKLEQTLTEALSSAVDQMFKDEELKKRLQ